MLPYPSRKKKSKKLFVVATVVAAAVFAGSYFVIAGSSDDQVIAKINGQKIFKSEIALKLHDVLDTQDGNNSPEIDKLPKEIIEILAKEVYLEKELTKEALKADATKTKEVKERIEESKNKILRQAYIDSILKKEVTDQKINDKYLELTKDLEGKKEYQIFHIVVKDKEEADKIAKELQSKKGGNKFAELAKKYSIDPDTSAKGGEIDYTLEDSMIKEIAAVVTTLEKDQISEPVQTKYGWHVIKLGDVREAKPLSFEAVKNNIRDQLIQDRVNEINNKIIHNAKVQILIQLKEIEKSADKNAPAKIEGVMMEETVPADNSAETTDADATAEAKVEDKSDSKVSEETQKAEESKNKSHAKDKGHKKSKR